MGLTPRICENLFKQIEEASSLASNPTLCYKTLISYIEIYNEKLRDLFDNTDASTNSTTPSQSTKLSNLRLREHPTKGIYIQNLNQFNVNDLKTTLKFLSKGNQNRLNLLVYF
jgi:hypothetical protein